MMQSFDATAFGGKRIIVKADVRLAGEAEGDARAQMWVRVDRPNEKIGFFDNMHGRPIRGQTYEQYTISGVVDTDAKTINIGLMVLGGATARIANVTVSAADALAPGETADRPGSPLTERGLVNMIALTKLYGYIRFFQPSDEAAGRAVKWDDFAIAAVEHVEGAADSGELAKVLHDVFGPILPTVPVKRSVAGVAEGRDQVLEAGVRTVSE